MTTITREQAQKIIDAADEVITALAGTNDDVHPDNSSKMCALWDDLNDRYAPPEVVRELARIALASLEAEPVAWTDADELRDAKNGGNGYLFAIGGNANKFADPRRQMMLYAASPAPVVPEELLSAMEEVLRISDRDHEAWHKARNGIVSCRAAMLQGSQPVSNRDELREQVRREHAEWSDATFGDVGPVGPLKHLSKEALEAAVNPEDSLEWADMQLLLWDAQRRMGLSDDFITRAMIEKLAINKTRQWPEPKDGEPRLHIKEQSESVFPEVECDICGHVSTDPEGRHYCCEDNSND